MTDAPRSTTPEVIERRVLERIAAYLDTDPGRLSRDSSFSQDLGMDSLDAFDLLFALEEEFDVDIPDEVAAGIDSVGEVIDGLVAELSGVSPDSSEPD